MGQAVRECQTVTGSADCILFVDRKPVAVIEAKEENHVHKIITVEEQMAGYAAVKLKRVSNNNPLPFLSESTGIITRFTDTRAPKLRSWQFAFAF